MLKTARTVLVVALTALVCFASGAGAAGVYGTLTYGAKSGNVNTPAALPLSSDGLSVPVTGTITATTSGLATTANQTNGTQKTQVVDGSGNVQPSGDVATRALSVAPAVVAGAPTIQNLALSNTSQAQFSSAACTRGAWVEAVSANTASVYVGPTGVTTGTGLELQAGDREFFPLDNVNRIFAITGTATQNLRAFCL